jgi:hypothetical protein
MYLRRIVSFMNFYYPLSIFTFFNWKIGENDIFIMNINIFVQLINSILDQLDFKVADCEGIYPLATLIEPCFISWEPCLVFREMCLVFMLYLFSISGNVFISLIYLFSIS